jgi:hypothetical protein
MSKRNLIKPEATALKMADRSAGATAVAPGEQTTRLSIRTSIRAGTVLDCQPMVGTVKGSPLASTSATRPVL